MLCWAVVILGWLGLFDQVAFIRHYMGVTWWRGRCGLSLGGVLRLWAASLAWWLLITEATSQGCDFGIMFFDRKIYRT